MWVNPDVVALFKEINILFLLFCICKSQKIDKLYYSVRLFTGVVVIVLLSSVIIPNIFGSELVEEKAL